MKISWIHLVLVVMIFLTIFYLVFGQDTAPLGSYIEGTPALPIPYPLSEASEIIPNLWISDAHFVSVLEHGNSPLKNLVAIVNVEDNESRSEIHLCARIPCLELPLPNTLHAHQEEIFCEKPKQTYAFIDQHISQGSVLVHCAAGMNRSVCTVIYYLMVKYHLSLQSALAYVKNKKPNISPDSTLLQALSLCF
jgi:predicted protein tyrosine phosphatase